MNFHKMIQEFGEQLMPVVGHRFDIIDVINPGALSIPVEGLSEDHTMGIYCEEIPRKMSKELASFTEITLSDLYPQSNGDDIAYLEFIRLRGSQFRAERLQYLEEGFWARVSECKYKAKSVLGALYVMQKVYGSAHIYINTLLPMPLWIRPNRIKEGTILPQVVIQAFSGNRCIPTNIHVDCPKECASLYYQACRSYYEIIGE